MTDAGSSNLPHPMTPLIGRQRELTEIGALLGNSDVRLVTLVGPGGVGKTRLALCAAEMACRDFIDGVCYVDLSPLTDHALVPTAVAQGLRLMPAAERPVEEALIEHLIARNLLLVLDNFEHLLEGVRLVPRLLAVCSELAVLVASRERLGVYGEHVYRVEPLEVPATRADVTEAFVAGNDAVHLFVERARAAQSSFALTDANAADIAAICVHLDGLPLAIELAAAQLRLFSAQALRGRLGEVLPFLSDGGRDLPSRHQTMREAIAWSYRLLTLEEQRLIRRLSVFVGGCSLEAAEAIARGSREQSVLDALSSLLDKSLLRRADGPDGVVRFLMLETVREFGLEQLQMLGEEDEVRWMHAGYFLQIAERAEPDLVAARYAKWTGLLDLDMANFRSSIQWCLSRGEAGSETALRTCKALWWYWKTRGHLGEARIWLQRTIELGGDSASMELASAMLLLGHSLLHFSIAQAESWYERSLDLSRRLGDQHGEASALRGLGMAAFDAAEYDDAQRFLGQCLTIYREVGDTSGCALATYYLASIESKRENYEGAARLFHEAVVEWRHIGHLSNMVYALIELARLERIRNNMDSALVLLRQATELTTQAGTNESEGYIRLELGQLALVHGDRHDALGRFVGSLASFHQYGYRDSFTAAAIEGIARVALTQSQRAEGVRLAAAAHTWRQTTRAQISQAERRVLEHDLGSARRTLGARLFDAEWLVGATMSLDDAIALALSLSVKTQKGGAVAEKVLPTDLQRLSPREREVLCLVARGRTDRDAANELGISVRTVTTLMTRVLEKLDGHPNRTSAAAYAVAHGMCDLSPGSA